ncbi:GNAT family N-acetyltransferase [Paraliobacillus zengyii]|uniref:GNAT family N-acetyltransferase n=1 Tax=Paraliobacillus zengyii TaxID=2213194 RepID=UPI000DD3BCE2|nr:GNAT family N-acetyltransferase [Paraliobacillus zengyii]
MEIRQLVADDASEYLTNRLIALQENPEAFGSSYEEEKNDSIEKYINRFKLSLDSFTFGAFEQSELIGTISLVKETKLKLKHRANIVAVYVKPENRGKGLGNALLLKAIEKAKTINEIEQLYLTVSTKNSAAKKVYKSMGFEICGTEERSLKYKDTYYDADHMVLFL